MNFRKWMGRMPILPQKYFCSVCGKKAAFFLPMGVKSNVFKRLHIIGGGRREHVVCPWCGANDRIRWIDYVIANMTDWYQSNKRILHIAPEPCIEHKMRKNKNMEYITGDICQGIADQVVDVTNMQFADGRFDCVIINHVLEHISDERKALEEISRVLCSGGVIFFSVPLCTDRNTYEADRELSEKERLYEYGQRDHCRLYGLDVKERVAAYGFDVEEYIVSQYLSDDEITRSHLMKEDRIYMGIKK